MSEFDVARLIAAELRERIAPNHIPAADYNWLVRSITAAIEKRWPADESRAEENPTLTDRELQVLKLLLHGYSNKEIARSLGMLDATVAIHLRTIMEKINVRTREQLREAGAKLLESLPG